MASKHALASSDMPLSAAQAIQWAEGARLSTKASTTSPSALINLQRISASRPYRQKPAN